MKKFLRIFSLFFLVFFISDFSLSAMEKKHKSRKSRHGKVTKKKKRKKSHARRRSVEQQIGLEEPIEQFEQQVSLRELLDQANAKFEQLMENFSFIDLDNQFCGYFDYEKYKNNEHLMSPLEENFAYDPQTFDPNIREFVEQNGKTTSILPEDLLAVSLKFYQTLRYELINHDKWRGRIKGSDFIEKYDQSLVEINKDLLGLLGENPEGSKEDFEEKFQNNLKKSLLKLLIDTKKKLEYLRKRTYEDINKVREGDRYELSKRIGSLLFLRGKELSPTEYYKLINKIEIKGKNDKKVFDIIKKTDINKTKRRHSKRKKKPSDIRLSFDEEKKKILIDENYLGLDGTISKLKNIILQLYRGEVNNDSFIVDAVELLDDLCQEMSQKHRMQGVLNYFHNKNYFDAVKGVVKNYTIKDKIIPDFMALKNIRNEKLNFISRAGKEFKSLADELINGLNYHKKKLVKSGCDLRVIGDIHGIYQTLSVHLRSLIDERKLGNDLKILDENLVLVFTGDLFDRGVPQSLELAYVVMLLKIKNPNNVYWIRGNHDEDPRQLEISDQSTIEELDSKLGSFSDKFVVNFFCHLLPLLPRTIYVKSRDSKSIKLAHAYGIDYKYINNRATLYHGYLKQLFNFDAKAAIIRDDSNYELGADFDDGQTDRGVIKKIKELYGNFTKNYYLSPIKLLSDSNIMLELVSVDEVAGAENSADWTRFKELKNYQKEYFGVFSDKFNYFCSGHDHREEFEREPFGSIKVITNMGGPILGTKMNWFEREEYKEFSYRDFLNRVIAGREPQGFYPKYCKFYLNRNNWLHQKVVLDPKYCRNIQPEVLGSTSDESTVQSSSSSREESSSYSRSRSRSRSRSDSSVSSEEPSVQPSVSSSEDSSSAEQIIQKKHRKQHKSPRVFKQRPERRKSKKKIHRRHAKKKTHRRSRRDVPPKKHRRKRTKQQPAIGGEPRPKKSKTAKLLDEIDRTDREMRKKARERIFNLQEQECLDAWNDKISEAINTALVGLPNDARLDQKMAAISEKFKVLNESLNKFKKERITSPDVLEEMERILGSRWDEIWERLQQD